MPEIITNLDGNQSQPQEDSSTVVKNIFAEGFLNSVDLPGEPFELVSDIGLDEAGSSCNGELSYAIEYSALGGRGGLRHLKSDSFKIEDTINYCPSPSSNDVYLPNDTFTGSSVSMDSEEFISIDIQPFLSSDVSESGSTIKNYTTFLSRPELWRASDGGPELYEVTNIESVKHFSIIPPDEVRMYEATWPGTQVGTATGTLYAEDRNKIFDIVLPTSLTFSSQPTGCSGIDWVGFSTVYPGDLVHDTATGAASTLGRIQRNTRIESISSDHLIINKSHTYTGIGSTTIAFTVRRIGPSSISREYGYHFRHYDWEDGYWQGQGPYDGTLETYHLENEFTSVYSYGFYYGKIPDGRDKKSGAGDVTTDINGNSRYNLYNTTGRWGVYVDDEVKNYFEGRIFVGHNIGIGTGSLKATVKGVSNTPTQPEPIVSVFNNKYKNQQDELDVGSSSCVGSRVDNPQDRMQYQMGLFVEDNVGIGTRLDLRYRLNVDASSTSVGIVSTTVERAARFIGDVEVNSGGVILVSPNGTKYRLVVSDGGTLSTVSV